MYINVPSNGGAPYGAGFPTNGAFGYMQPATQHPATAAAMAALAAGGGIAPTDPRLQPFMKMAREEHMKLRTKVLVSNGMSEAAAREEVERSMPQDRFHFFGQALMYYLSSLTGDANAFNMSLFQQQQQFIGGTLSQAHVTVDSGAQASQASGLPWCFGSVCGVSSMQAPGPTTVPEASDDATSATYTATADGASLPGLSLGPLQRLLAGGQAKCQPGTTVRSTGKTGSNVLAAAQNNVTKTKGTRFDVTGAKVSKGETSAPTLQNASSFCGEESFFSQQHVDKALQQWTYRVYSSHQKVPQGVDPKFWRQQLLQFINRHSTWVQTEYTEYSKSILNKTSSSSAKMLVPSWLSNCRVPTVSEVLQATSFFTQSDAATQQLPRQLLSSCDVSRSRTIGEFSPVSSAEKSDPENQTSDTQVHLHYAGARKCSSSRSSDSSDSPSKQFPSHWVSPSRRRDSKPYRGKGSNAPHRVAEVTANPHNATSATALPQQAVFNFSTQTPAESSLFAISTGGSDTNLWDAQVQGKKRRGKGKKGQIFGPLIANGSNGSLATKPNQHLTSSDERKKREERVRRFGGGTETPLSSSHGTRCSNSVCRNGLLSSRLMQSSSVHGSDDPAVTKSPVRLLTWQEKLQLLTSVERVRGKSQALEKPYLRLCGPPDPALVRPEAVLVRSFYHCLEKWNREKNYRFIEEQFRSIRQDLTVQGVKNAFTLLVYETNARIALENLDLGQFNQCQTQVRELHRSLHVSLKDREEFLAYRLLYLTLTNMRHDLLKFSGELSPEEKKLPAVQFADSCRRAYVEGNSHRLLRLSVRGPFLSNKLISIFLNRLRMNYLLCISRSHYIVPFSFLKKELIFDSDFDCRRFLIENNAVWAVRKPGGEDSIDCRKSAAIFEASPLLQNRKVNALG